MPVYQYSITLRLASSIFTISLYRIQREAGADHSEPNIKSDGQDERFLGALRDLIAEHRLMYALGGKVCLR